MGVREKIVKIKDLEKKGIENPDYRKVLIQTWEERAVQTTHDQEIGKKFLKNAQDGALENDNRFRLKYIFDLNLDGIILIVLGKKNIGKTYEFVQLINKVCSQGDDEIVLVRMQVKELFSALVPLLNFDDRSHVKIIQKAGGYYELVHKTRTDEHGKPKRCGFAASISTLTGHQGASYDHVKYIIGDECISDDGNVKISQSDLNAFDRFLSSVIRDKDDCKVLIFGNLLTKVNNVAGDAVLNHFGIPIDTNCKYIETSTGAKVLFLNTRNLFKGIESQKVLAGVDTAMQKSLLNNTIVPKGIKTVGKYDFYAATPLYALVFTYNKVTYVCHVALPQDNDPHDLYGIINLCPLTNEALYDYDVYTDSPIIFNSYSHHMQIVKESKFLRLWNNLIKMASAGKVLYSDDYTSTGIKIYMDHYQSKIESKTKLRKNA